MWHGNAYLFYIYIVIIIQVVECVFKRFYRKIITEFYPKILGNILWRDQHSSVHGMNLMKSHFLLKLCDTVGWNVFFFISEVI